jgi:hypothetical protein
MPLIPKLTSCSLLHKVPNAIWQGMALADGDRFDLIYDGPALARHQMEARELGPALLALGNLITEANHRLNEDRAAVKVFVDSEMRPGSFSVAMEVWQRISDGGGAFLALGGVKTAKDILEWLDLLRPGGVVSASWGLLGYYRVRDGRKESSAQIITDVNGGNVVQISFSGDHNTYNLSPEVYKIANDPKVAKAIKGVLQPLSSTGIEDFRTKQNGVEQTRISKDEVPAITHTCDAVIEDPHVLSRNIIEAHLLPCDPTFLPNAQHWGFWYGDRHITVDISETSISRDAVDARTVSMDDIYNVDMEITERMTPGGQIRHDYKITRVRDKSKGPTQMDWLDEPPK